VFPKPVVADCLPDFLDNHTFYLLSWPIHRLAVFGDVGSQLRLTLRIHFENSRHDRCQVVWTLDGETELEIGNTDLFNLGIEPEVGFTREGEEDEESAPGGRIMRERPLVRSVDRPRTRRFEQRDATC
jgi:hypothetical protein